jgi:hypothetical protein
MEAKVLLSRMVSLYPKLAKLVQSSSILSEKAKSLEESLVPIWNLEGKRYCISSE